jgi:uncharacterized protein YcfL
MNPTTQPWMPTMTKLIRPLLLATSLLAAALPAQAQSTVPAYASSAGVAAKMMVRGEFKDIKVTDLRSQRRNDVLTVQAEVYNANTDDARVYYRFRWLDAGGMQVGDGETWKPLIILGQQSLPIQGVAYGPQATDFRLEMSSEAR